MHINIHFYSRFYKTTRKKEREKNTSYPLFGSLLFWFSSSPSSSWSSLRQERGDHMQSHAPPRWALTIICARNMQIHGATLWSNGHSPPILNATSPLKTSLNPFPFSSESFTRFSCILFCKKTRIHTKKTCTSWSSRGKKKKICKCAKDSLSLWLDLTLSSSPMQQQHRKVILMKMAN